MKRLISVALLTAFPAGCAHDSPCVPVYDDQGRLVHTNTCMKGTTQITGKQPEPSPVVLQPLPD